MNARLLIPLLLIATASSSSAYGKKHGNLPEEFASAKTVFVEAPDGSDITNLRLDAGERSAILTIQDGVQEWGRYVLSRSRQDADLILVVRKGMRVRDQGSQDGGSGFPSTARTPNSHVPMQDPSDASQGAGGDVSPDGFKQEKDALQVYTLQPNGKLKGPIWASELERGLSPPNPLLLHTLKEDVERAYPAPPTSSPQYPDVAGVSEGECAFTPRKGSSPPLDFIWTNSSCAAIR